MKKNWQKLKEDARGRKYFFLRAKIISLIRDFFYSQDFLEVETPSLVRLPGMEPYLDPVETEILFGGEKSKAYLITSPEYAMKKILAAGFPKIFQICKSFRGGEGSDRLHNPEFTMLEWYRANADYWSIMEDAENLFLHIAGGLAPAGGKGEGKEIFYRGKKIDLSPPWIKMTVREAFKKYAKIDLDKVLDIQELSRAAISKGYSVEAGDRFEDIFFKIFLNEIEPNFEKAKPIIIYDWPVEMAALARRKSDGSRYAERFEIYAGGMELGNAFSELIDKEEQRERLLGEKKLRKKMGKEVYGIDEDFLTALKSMPPSGGIAMGVDRVVMLFSDAKEIEDIIFFPAKEIF